MEKLNLFFLQFAPKLKDWEHPWENIFLNKIYFLHNDQKNHQKLLIVCIEKTPEGFNKSLTLSK